MTIDQLWTALNAEGICCDAVRGGLTDISEAPSEWCDRSYLKALAAAAGRGGYTVVEVVDACRLAVGNPTSVPPVRGDRAQLMAILAGT